MQDYDRDTRQTDEGIRTAQTSSRTRRLNSDDVQKENRHTSQWPPRQGFSEDFLKCTTRHWVLQRFNLEEKRIQIYAATYTGSCIVRREVAGGLGGGDRITDAVDVRNFNGTQQGEVYTNTFACKLVKGAHANKGHPMTTCARLFRSVSPAFQRIEKWAGGGDRRRGTFQTNYIQYERIKNRGLSFLFDAFGCI